MKCEYCDNEIPLGSTRCPSCGATVKAAPAAAPAPAVAAPAGGAPYAAPVVNVNLQQPALPPKSRTVYVILAIFFGGLGIHNFYAGFAGRGIVQLLISVLSCGWCGIISWIWALIEACVVTVDARGVHFA